MNRRDFVAGAGAILGVAAAGAVSTAADSDAVKQAIADNYALYRGTDFGEHTSCSCCEAEVTDA